MKKVIVNGIPRQAVLKPAHAVYRLQNQRFDIGDRVVMVKDSGSVPLSIKGVIIGINAKSLDVVWDVSFMSGSTLGNRCVARSNLLTGEISAYPSPRCSQYRGATVEFHTCLNLSNPQVVTSTNTSKSQPSHVNGGPPRGATQRSPPQSVWKPPINQGLEFLSQQKFNNSLNRVAQPCSHNGKSSPWSWWLRKRPWEWDVLPETGC